MYILINQMTQVINTTIHIKEPLKFKLFDVKSSIYIDFNRDNNNEGPKFKVGGHVKTSKYKNIFAKGYVQNWSGEVL